MSQVNGTSARAAGPLATRTSGTVRVVGSGLLGASVGHALTALGVDVVLVDASPSQLRLAIDYGAGRAERLDDRPSLIVVAVPPDVTADVVQRELERFPDAVVTDVASVKLEPLRTCGNAASTSRTTSARTPWPVVSVGEPSRPAPTSSSDARGWCAATARPLRTISRSSRGSPSISARPSSR